MKNTKYLLLFLGLNLIFPVSLSFAKCEKLKKVVKKLTKGIEIEVSSTISPEELTGRIKKKLKDLGYTVSKIDTSDTAQIDIRARKKEWSSKRSSIVWRITEDDSIIPSKVSKYPIEIVGPIMSKSADLEDYLKVINSLEDVIQGEPASSGIHIHIGAKKFDEKQIATIFQNFQKIESFLLKEFPIHKSRQEFTEKIETINEKKIKRILANYDRHKTLNLASLKKHGTLEFRFINSTTDTEIIIFFVDFLDRFIKKTHEINTQKIESWEELLTVLEYSKVEQEKMQGLQKTYHEIAKTKGPPLLSILLNSPLEYSLYGLAVAGPITYLLSLFL